jgi:proton-dependent oligopeptide transporter, POT family
MDAAKPSYQLAHTQQISVTWDDLFVDELKRALVACRVFIAFPIFWLCYGQMSTNLVSQARTMVSHGLPNDILMNINPISIVVLVPIMETVLYPFLRKIRVPFKPISRMTFGFLLSACAMAYAAGLQAAIYNTGPCYNHPLFGNCSEGGKIPNQVHMYLHRIRPALTILDQHPPSDPNLCTCRNRGNFRRNHRAGIRLYQGSAFHEILRHGLLSPHKCNWFCAWSFN